MLGISSVKDFKKKRQAKRESSAEPVTLPSGLTVLASRPGPLWFAAHGGLPGGLAAKLSAGPEAREPFTADDAKALSERMITILSEIVVEPKLSLNPKDDNELSPDDIDDKDLDYLLKWGVGEVATASDGSATDLSSFRGQPTNAAPSDNGGHVEVQAEFVARA